LKKGELQDVELIYSPGNEDDIEIDNQNVDKKGSE